MELAEEPQVASLTARIDSRLDAESVLARLPAGYRAILILNAEGFTHAEIGRLLGISDGTSKSQLSRARNAVLRLAGGEYER